MLYFLVSATVRIIFPVHPSEVIVVDPLTYQTSFEKKICQVDGDFLDILILVLFSPRRKSSVMVTSPSLLMVIPTVSTGDDPSQPAVVYSSSWMVSLPPVVIVKSSLPITCKSYTLAVPFFYKKNVLFYIIPLQNFNR